MAQEAGIDRSTLQRIEAGSHDTRISQLLRLARALHLPVRDLMP
ncbi:helix-turn-helix domain-containing protein [Streptomyces goshikiensis]